MASSNLLDVLTIQKPMKGRHTSLGSSAQIATQTWVVWEIQHKEYCIVVMNSFHTYSQPKLLTVLGLPMEVVASKELLPTLLSQCDMV